MSAILARMEAGNAHVHRISRPPGRSATAAIEMD